MALPPFTGGLVGYFSYDYMKYAEPTLRLAGEDQERFKDMDLMLFRSVIAFDNFRQKLILITNADASDLDETYPAACQQLDRMAELTQATEAPVVYMGSNSSFLATAPASMYQSTLIRQAGGVNAGDSLEGDYWTEVSYEDVLAMAPQVIVLPAGAEYTVQDVVEDPQLSALPAVQDGAVYQMPGGIEEWDSPVPSGILGTMWMTSVLHPDVYPFEEFTADAQDFYQTFYGFSVDASLITK